MGLFTSFFATIECPHCKVRMGQELRTYFFGNCWGQCSPGDTLFDQSVSVHFTDDIICVNCKESFEADVVIEDGKFIGLFTPEEDLDHENLHIDTVKDLFMLIKGKKTLMDQFVTVYTHRRMGAPYGPTNMTALEELEYIDKMKRYIQRFFEVIGGIESVSSEDIVLVYKLFLPDFYDPFEMQTIFSSVLIHADNLKHIDPETFTVQDEKKENNLCSYDYEFCDIEQILGFKFANVCISEYGLIECALSVFEEIKANVTNPELHKKWKEELEENANELEKRKGNLSEDYDLEYFSFDDALDDIDKMIYSEMEEDEATYFRLKNKNLKKFEDDPLVQEIEERQIAKTQTINQEELRRVIRLHKLAKK